MRKTTVIFLVVAALVLLISNLSWGQCPEQPNDLGECDTLHLFAYEANLAYDPPFVEVESFPAFVEVMLMVTHDIDSVEVDSLRGIVIPLVYTRSNLAAYCSVSTYWNTTNAAWVFPDFVRSIFRHKVNESDPADTIYHNRMAQMAADLMGREWAQRLLQTAHDSSWVKHGSDSTWVPPHVWMSFIGTGADDQCWWEGDRVLLATLTFRIQDSMTVCIDSMFWPPTGQFLYTRKDSKTFVPRHHLPYSFKVDTVPPNSVREIQESEDSRPSEFSLSQNYPNPFNPVTNIEFALSRVAHVKIDIYNIVGQRVRTLVDEDMKPGRYVADWDGKDEKGNSVSSGIYFYRMDAGDFSDMKKMLLVK